MNTVLNIIEMLADTIRRTYDKTREEAARPENIQEIGHQTEAIFVSLLEQWLPNYPIVSRKYVQGPLGRTREIDILVLHPDYPTELRTHSTILASGVLMAFSVKRTFKRHHIAEALAEKREILEIHLEATTVKDALVGQIPFGLLALSSDVSIADNDFDGSIIELYENFTVGSVTSAIEGPREELDCLLIADTSFFSTVRSGYFQNPNDINNHGPVSVFSRYIITRDIDASALVNFLAWLHSKFHTLERSSLDTLQQAHGSTSQQGYAHRWPLSVYPKHISMRPELLLNEFGFGKTF